MNETLLDGKLPYAIVTVDVDREGEKGRLLTLHAKTKEEWQALFIRLIGYGHKEEHMVEVERSTEFMNLEAIEDEKKALEWRLDFLNEVVHTNLKKD
jgi:hypothetical protein